MLLEFWKDEGGFIVTAELVLICTICVLGLVVGLCELQSCLVFELCDISRAFCSFNQGFCVPGFRGCKGTKSFGSCFYNFNNFACGAVIDSSSSFSVSSVGVGGFGGGVGGFGGGFGGDVGLGGYGPGYGMGYGGAYMGSIVTGPIYTAPSVGGAATVDCLPAQAPLAPCPPQGTPCPPHGADCPVAPQGSQNATPAPMATPPAGM